jgi:hypothetical protein
MAGTALADAARDYLRLRNSLGHDLAEYYRELTRLAPLQCRDDGRFDLARAG